MWQNLPQSIDPVAFSLGPLDIYWYGIMWLIAFGSAYAIMLYRHKKNETSLTLDQIGDVLSWALLGALIGGRLGYVFFYDIQYFLAKPLQILVPYEAGIGWIGISGMSYHGGLIGIIVALWAWTRRNKVPSLQLFDSIVPAASFGYIFGRIGNFLGAELVGRQTDVPWGVDFGDGITRHPSQLYEAFGEGLVIFCIVWVMRTKCEIPGMLSALYVALYGCVRFIIEFFRAADPHIGYIGGIFTRGHILSLGMIVCGIALAMYLYRAHHKSFIHNSKK